MAEKASAKKVRSAPVERGSLSPDGILRSALAIADRDGLAGLTVRKLATELAVSPMAVYRHYENKAAIVHDLVDLVVGDYEVTAHAGADWREWAATCFLRMRYALCVHPEIIPLVDHATSQGSNALAVMEEVLDRLREAGIEAATAAQLFQVLMAYTIGSVVMMDAESRRRVAGHTEDIEEQLRQQRLRFEVLPRGRYPNVVELAPHLAQLFGDESFRRVIWRILEDVE